MPDITPNLGLKKPLGTETVSRATYNENLEIMDANAVKKGNGIAELTGGTLADRPAAGVAGRYYFAQDTGEIYLDTGTAWVLAAAGREDITALQEGLDAHQADETQHVPYAVASGSANTYAVTLNPAPDAYIDGFAIAIKINTNNTGASTINVNGLGAKAIKKPNGNDVSAGNLKISSIYTMRYNGTNFILQGSDAAGNATPADILSGKTATTDAGEITGTIPSKSAQTYTAGTTDQTIAAGQHLSGIQTIKGDANLLASNILSGKSIFGVAGSVTPKYYATGTVHTSAYKTSYVKYDNSSVDMYTVTVSGLTFLPSLILMTCKTGYATDLETAGYSINNLLLPSFGEANLFSARVGSTIYLKVDGTNLYVTSSGFKLATQFGVADFTWYAFG